MYYMANRKYDYKMSFREFKRSHILKSLLDIETEPDINLNPDFFSYEDFYVIYIRFWELDNDHDFQLSREELSKYSGYTLSRKTLERIFSQTVKSFEFEEKMGFGDFVWFILCVEDKTTEQSIEFWFKVMDLDGNGVITGYELEYFYEEQSQRLNYMESNLDLNF
jgi:serine/threonine-protein phosphatase 2A regulatory subunit B''